MLPPISDANGAAAAPLSPTRAPSPPEDPPDPNLVLKVLKVLPHRLLLVSSAIPVCGIAVFAKIIAIVLSDEHVQSVPWLFRSNSNMCVDVVPTYLPHLS